LVRQHPCGMSLGNRESAGQRYTITRLRPFS